MPALSRAARAQKLAVPTFHVPSSSTAVPFWPVSMGVPLTRIVYTTDAWVEEVSVIDWTDADAVAPCGFFACASSTGRKA